MNIEIPNYTLIRQLGSGAMAQVWLAEHRVNRRMSAIKILQRSLLHDTDAERLFLREGEVLAGFRDENIVAIYDNARVGDYAYIAMEFLPGGTLLERMRRGPISVGESLAYVAQAARALGVAHRAGVIHRDLKPANIMFRDEGTPVLTDFGAARVLERSTIYGKDGGIIGTPVYMSPEQIQGFPLDGRSDLYSLGVLFHELLTGQLPYRGGSIAEIASQHVLAPLPVLPKPVAMLQPVLDKLLAKLPEDRFRDADQVVDALRELYLSDGELRRQVGFSASSAAWSSQLRAMGFVLDSQGRTEARKAQGDYLHGVPPPHPPVPRPSAWRAIALVALLLLFVVAGMSAWLFKPVPRDDADIRPVDQATTDEGTTTREHVALDTSGPTSTDPGPPCDAGCASMQRMLAAAQSGFEGQRGAPLLGSSSAYSANVSLDDWFDCVIAGSRPSEHLACRSSRALPDAERALLFQRTRAALTAAAPAAVIERDQDKLFSITDGNQFGEVLSVDGPEGSYGYAELRFGRNRIGVPGTTPP